MPSDSPSFNGGQPYEYGTLVGGGPITAVDLAALITGATGSPTSCVLTSFEFELESLGLTQSEDYTDCHLVSGTSINSSGVLSVTTDEIVGTRRVFFTLNYAGGVSVSGSVAIDVAAVGGGGGGGGGGSGGTYSEPATDYIYGETGSSNWQTSSTSAIIEYSDGQAWMRFLDASGPIGATSITSAILTITSDAEISSPEFLSVQSSVTANESLPTHDTDAAMKQMSNSAASSGSFEGQTSVEIDVAALVAEVSGGSTIVMRVTNPTYAGSSISFAASLVIEYA